MVGDNSVMDAIPPEPPNSNPDEASRAATGPTRKGTDVAMSTLRQVAIALLATLAGLIAFSATCFPIGYVGMWSGAAGVEAEITVGLFACIVGAVVAFGVVRLILKTLKPRRNVLPVLTNEAHPR